MVQALYGILLGDCDTVWVLLVVDDMVYTLLVDFDMVWELPVAGGTILMLLVAVDMFVALPVACDMIQMLPAAYSMLHDVYNSSPPACGHLPVDYDMKALSVCATKVQTGVNSKDCFHWKMLQDG